MQENAKVFGSFPIIYIMISYFTEWYCSFQRFEIQIFNNRFTLKKKNPILIFTTKFHSFNHQAFQTYHPFALNNFSKPDNAKYTNSRQIPYFKPLSINPTYRTKCIERVRLANFNIPPQSGNRTVLKRTIRHRTLCIIPIS